MKKPLRRAIKGSYPTSLLKILHVVASQACVLCSYCSIEIKKREKNKGHTENNHKKKSHKEKRLLGQQMFSSHIVLEIKQDDNKDGGKSSKPKPTRKYSEEPLIEQDKHED